jgi:hypothetical protein
MWNHMVDVHFLPAAKRNVQRAFEDALKTLDELGREADRWEQARLVYALCSMAEGQYGDAAVRIFEVAKSTRQAGRQSDPPEVACHQGRDAPGSHPHLHPLLDLRCP